MTRKETLEKLREESMRLHRLDALITLVLLDRTKEAKELARELQRRR